MCVTTPSHGETLHWPELFHPQAATLFSAHATRAPAIAIKAPATIVADRAMAVERRGVGAVVVELRVRSAVSEFR